ncbi:polysaccharide deacetylase family protein [Geodermatophilus poikilotrophus]|uniref:polysaccharide deacetylase family protein n=1 Tax=Geodermatophilus poikilotrophus TaxID=1333667 RepID=UPI000B8A470D|nr:polysaccharide deacetylase family protein [Geodermatophilus poikilotrophus]
MPLVAVLVTVGWQRYTDGRDDVAQAAPGANLLPAVSADGSATPGGWRVDHSLDADVSLGTAPGHVTERALRVDVPRYRSGDVTLTSPRVAVSADRTYLFKAFVSGGDPGFTLLARYSTRDGADRLVSVREYPEERLPWSTVSAAFRPDADVVAVQYVLRIASTGTLDVDGAYLVPAHDVHVDPAVPPGPNLLPNPELTASGEAVPDQWSPYREGATAAEFAVREDDRGRFLETRVTDRRTGEAKWEHAPIPVRPDQYLRFTATYRSDRPVDVRAEFLAADGRYEFADLATLPPAGEWTEVTQHLQVPTGATSGVVTLVSRAEGTAAVRGQVLTDVSRPGAPRWSRPLVSVTFDDGWESSYTHGVRLLEERGFPGTFYVNPAVIETPDFMTAAQLQALDRQGHEVALHGYEHFDLTTLSAERLDEQLWRGQEALAAAGLPTEHLAVPHGRTDAQVEWYARQHLQTLRTTETGVNTRQNLEPYRLRTFYVDQDTKPEHVAWLLEETKRTNGWLILIYHKINPMAEGGDARVVFNEAFSTQLDLVRDSGITVVPVAEAFAEVSTS